MKDVTKHCPNCGGVFIKSVWNYSVDRAETYCNDCLYLCAGDDYLGSFMNFFNMYKGENMASVVKTRFVSDKMYNLATSLGVLAGKVNEEEWQFIKLVKENLVAQAEIVKGMESNLTLLRSN